MRYTRQLIGSFLSGLMLLGMVGCDQRYDQPESAGTVLGDAPVKIQIKNGLRATGDDSIVVPTDALPREKKVSSLYAVAYRDNGVFYNVLECTPVTGEDGAYTFDMKAEGKFQFVLVANPDGALLGELKTGTSVIGDIDRIVVAKLPGEDNKAEDFVLTSDRVEVTTAKNTEATTDPAVIKLQRLSARFDFLNRVPELQITKITFNKRMTQSYLYARTDVSALTSTTDKTYETAQGLEPRQCKATIYGYENPVPNDTYFTIEGTFAGKEIKPYTIRLDNMPVKRNYLYTIVISPLGGSVDPSNPGDQKPDLAKLPIKVRVLDWEEGAPIKKDDAELIAAMYIEHSATIDGASFMDPYLRHSPAEIYTVSKDDATVHLKIGTYVAEGELELKENITGVTLTEEGTATKEADGKIVRSYKLTLPKQDRYADLAQHYLMIKQGRDVSALPYFLEVPLIAKGPTGEEIETFVVHHGRMKTPLEHMAEYTLKGDDDGKILGFNNTYDNTKQSYFKIMKLSKALDAVGGKWAHDGRTYHLPKDLYEWNSIFPEDEKYAGKFARSKGYPFRHNVAEEYLLPRLRYYDLGNGTITPVLFAGRSDYATAENGKIAYGLKFKSAKGPDYATQTTDDRFVVAYRYEWVGNFNMENKDVDTFRDCHLKVTARYLGKGWQGDIYDIRNEAFWQKDKSQDAERIFPFAGVDTPIDWASKKGAAGIFPVFKDKYGKREDPNGDDARVGVANVRPQKIDTVGQYLTQWDSTGFTIFLFSHEL